MTREQRWLDFIEAAETLLGEPIHETIKRNLFHRVEGRTLVMHFGGATLSVDLAKWK